MKLLTAAEMREVDRRTIEEVGVPVWALMENAGRALAEQVEARFVGGRERRALVVCGRGNNGGDGMVCGRHLANRGWTVEVVLLGSVERLRSDVVRGNAAALSGWGIAVVEATTSDDLERTLAGRRFDVVIDAIFGTGFTPPAAELESAAIARIGALRGDGAWVVAVDLPSGLDADRASVESAAVEADLSVTFAAAKLAHYLPPASLRCGRVVVADICIPQRLIDVDSHRAELTTRALAATLLPSRPRDGHKGTFGHLLVVAGSRGKTGAAILTARAALRSGVGLVTVATPASSVATVAGGAPELMTVALAESSSGACTLKARTAIVQLASRCDAVAIGPGLGTEADTVALIAALLPELTTPTVLDADALNALSAADHGLSGDAEVVATPHPGEAARLLARTTEQVTADRLGAAREIASSRRWVTVLKGRGSIVAAPDGRVRINPTGNSGMATAGSGDVLTGIVGALLAQGLAPFAAATVASYVHGDAGDRAATIRGERSLVAGDLIEALSDVFPGLAGDGR